MVMKRNGFFYVLFLIVSFQLQAQVFFSDTLFVDGNKNVTSFNDAEFIRIIRNDTSGIIRFEVTDYDLNNNIVYHGYYKSLGDNIKTGIHTEYYSNGKIKSTRQYENNLLEGIVENFDTSGSRVKAIAYEGGLLNGPFITYYKNGQVKRKDLYEQNKFLNGTCYTISGIDTSYYPYVILPSYKGGWSHFNTYLFDELKASDNFKLLTEKSSAVLKVTINSKGVVEKINILSGNKNKIINEAVKLITNSTNWNPGFIDGQPGDMSIKIPLEFFPEGKK